MDIQIMIAAHKKAELPTSDIYLPVQVGAAGKADIGYTRDDSGDNISAKNPYYCELTGIYWGWKNLDVEYCGLVHYRRYFAKKKGARGQDANWTDYVSDRAQIEAALKKADVLVPVKRNYYIMSLYDHYKNTHYEEHLILTGEIIQEKYPEYMPAYEKLKKRTSGHMFNMFVMKKNLYNEYCQWLFDILFELEKRVDLSQYDPYQARLFGRVSELLLDVWLETKNQNYVELPCMMVGKVDMFRKVTSFVKAKIFKEKYEKSF